MSNQMVEPLDQNRKTSDTRDDAFSKNTIQQTYEQIQRISYQAGFFVNASQIRKDDDYFACDDSVIRSPTYYTKTNVDSRFDYNSDLKSLLQPMFPQYDEETKATDDESQLQDNSTFNKNNYDDDAMEFEKRIEQSIQKSPEGSGVQRKSTRKPEDVKFRTLDEERASLKLQGQEKGRKRSAEERVNVDSFEFLGLIGQGAYGKVFMAKKKQGGKFYAIKMIQKHKIMKAGKQQEVFRERQALITLDHPNIVKMYWSFDDKKYLYFVLDLAPNGELFSIIQREGKIIFKMMALIGKLQHELAQFLSAEIINILQYMHSKGISHRDLKPSNLLFDENHHLKIVDFGCSKVEEVKKQARLRSSICIEINPQEQQNNIEEYLTNKDSAKIQKKATLVGTEDYIAPEILDQTSAGRPADIWSLGVIIYMMICGRSPFKGTNQVQTFNNIQNVNYQFTDDFSPDARDLIQKLLKRNPIERLGAGEPGSLNDYDHLKSHAFFKGIDFDKVFLMITPYNFKKFQRSTLRQQLLEQKQQDESSNDVVVTSSGIEEEHIDENIQQKFSANIIMNGNLKKKTRLGFFYKRIVTLTDEPKLHYLKDVKDKIRTKHIVIDPDITRLERPDKTKFRIVLMIKGKKQTYEFRCHDANECDQWVLKISNELDKCKNQSPDKYSFNQFKQGSQSQVNALKKMQSQDSAFSSKSYVSKSAHKGSGNLHE